jgi:hypothetical protein
MPSGYARGWVVSNLFRRAPRFPVVRYMPGMFDPAVAALSFSQRVPHSFRQRTPNYYQQPPPKFHQFLSLYLFVLYEYSRYW